jgi:hypothetical protein
MDAYFELPQKTKVRGQHRFQWTFSETKNKSSSVVSNYSRYVRVHTGTGAGTDTGIIPAYAYGKMSLYVLFKRFNAEEHIASIDWTSHNSNLALPSVNNCSGSESVIEKLISVHYL